MDFLTPDKFPPLKEGQVHVWRVSTIIPDEKIRRLSDILSEDERERLGRFHFPKDRVRFAAGRATLRTLLGRYSETDSASIAFIRSSHGKPFAAPESAARHFTFSVSHSGNLAVIAVARDVPVGVDIERLRMRVDFGGIIRRFFAPEEIEAFLALPENARPAAFFAVWTRKESLLKAIGEGLAGHLNSFAVSVSADEPPRVLRFRDEPGPGGWTIADLSPGPDYKAGLAVKHPSPEILCLDEAGIER
jgi:4'-phosphopantetheinyl transferase